MGASLYLAFTDYDILTCPMNVPNNTDREIGGLLQRDGVPDRDVIAIGAGVRLHEQGALTFLNKDAAVCASILKGERHQLP